jgi:hypothetical protein
VHTGVAGLYGRKTLLHSDVDRPHAKMALGLGSMLYVVLLLINAVAVLNEERFLARGPQPPNDVSASNSCLMQSA